MRTSSLAVAFELQIKLLTLAMLFGHLPDIIKN